MTPELDLFSQPEPLQFDGATMDHVVDGPRLAEQHKRVAGLMQDHAWRTLAEIEAVTGDPQASVSARLRDLRKVRFGGYTVERRRRSKGLHEYRVLERSAVAA